MSKLASAENKENASTSLPKPKSKRPRTTSKASKPHCLCRKPDDGSPMIRCEECREWYHFRCVKLEERDAEEIQTYICPSCNDRTGLRTIMTWEGVEGLEIVGNGSKSKAAAVKREYPDSGKDSDMNSASSDDGSGDEYVEEEVKPRVTVRRRTRRVSVSSGSGSDSDQSSKKNKTPKRLRRQSTQDNTVYKSKSPGASSVTKRRQSTTAEPPSKRAKASSGEDPARHYCLTKLEELFCPIFLRHPFLDGRRDSSNTLQPSKKQEELTDEEKEKLEMNAKHFAADLEKCIFELYADSDKNGKRAVGSKYKERFRMLTFNLSKPDRVLLHKRIASSNLSPNELSTMSSTELADEETQQSIRHAEEEALAHSILKKQTLPRAKITHKGIENIEDVNGVSRDAEQAREEREEEERIERERLARLRLQAERARSASTHGQGSVPPESPVVPQTPTWGAPPPVPLHASHPDVGVGRPPVNPLFVPSASDYQTPVEGELNLADLINIDEDGPSDVPSIAPTPTPFGDDTPPPFDSQTPGTQTLPPPSPTAPTSSTGISPFAARPDMASRPSFDLNSLWTPKGDVPSQEQTSEQTSEPHDVPMADAEAEPLVEPDALGEAAEDQDFDMFLGKDEEGQPATETPPPAIDDSPEGQRAAFEALPKVWMGTLSMPLDSAMAQDVSLNARQTGGRSLGGDSPLWQTLFPTKELRIDGRVPVDKSAQYLTQMRLNPTKELMAVAFSPEPGTGTESAGFKLLVDHLVAKGRHGLVFPWGNRPKDWAPGRELYIVPLLSIEPIPEYMELLDDLRLPKQRTSNYLIGVWVLNKGKLAPPPVSAAPAPLPGAPTVQLPQALLDLLPSLTQQTQTVPQSAASPPTLLPENNATLAAEVAQLTPEQIQLMLRTLSSTGLAPQPPAPSASPPIVPPTIPPIPAIPGMPMQQSPPPLPPQQGIPLQPWLNQPAGYPPPYQPPPPNMYPGQGPPPPHPYPGDMHQEYYERDRPGPRGRYDGPGDRGYRGGRGRNRGRGHNRDHSHDRPRDSGWKSRGRGRGGGGGGPSGPPRGRGRSDHNGWS